MTKTTKYRDIKSYFFLLKGELQDGIKVASEQSLKRFSDIIYQESRNNSFPPVGTRVRRGPDWKYGNQDSERVGTIIGHAEERRL